MSVLQFQIAAATNVGLVRTNNEDNYIVSPDLTKGKWSPDVDYSESVDLGDYGCLLVVADGMGGMNAGEVASEIAVNSIKSSFSDMNSLPDNVEKFMRNAIVKADREIKDYIKKDGSTEGMGTTIVACWILADYAHVAWCGDSRAYLFNPRAGLSRLSKDHSYVQQLVDNGELEPELAFYHPNSNIITRSLGDSSSQANPDYICRRLASDDYILLCSDGLCGLCKDDEILEVMSGEHESLCDCRDALIQAALDAGGHDNVTVALFHCLQIEEVKMNQTLVSSSRPSLSSRLASLFSKKKNGN